MQNPDEIFVFGSNEAGRHGAGAALYAMRHLGAQIGIGFGPTGRTFAIPTKNFYIQKLDLLSVALYIDLFVQYAKENPDTTFRLSPIGCGLAGFTVEEIVPLFDEAPSNVLPPRPEYDKISREFYDAYIARLPERRPRLSDSEQEGSSNARPRHWKNAASLFVHLLHREPGRRQRPMVDANSPHEEKPQRASGLVESQT